MAHCKNAKELLYVISNVADDYGDICCPTPDTCVCSMSQAIKIAKQV